MVGFLPMSRSVEQHGGSICPLRKLFKLTFFLSFPVYSHSWLLHHLTRLFPLPVAKGQPSTDCAPAQSSSLQDTLQGPAPSPLPACKSAALSVHPRGTKPTASGQRPEGTGDEPQQSRRASFKWPGHHSHFIFRARRPGLCQ